MKRAIVAVLVVLAVFYAADYLVLRSRSQPYSTVTIQDYYAVPRKDGRTEYMLQDPITKSCVHSVLPHFGCAPCWYLSKRTEERENI